MPTCPKKCLLAAVRLRCPVCLEGPVFQGWFEARRKCERCGYFYARESGYFGGSIIVGYAATILVTFFVGIGLGYGLGLGWGLAVIIPTILVAAIFPVWFFRYARILWMCVDLYLNPPVKEDFESRGR